MNLYIIGITVTFPADPAGAVFDHPRLNFLSLPEIGLAWAFLSLLCQYRFPLRSPP